MNRPGKRDPFVQLTRCVALLAAVLSAGLSSAQNTDSAKAFLGSIYRHYENNGSGIGIGSPHAGRYFSASLLALVRADDEAVGPGYVGAIDADPVCACQDWEGIWNLSINVKVQTPEHAEADVSFYLSAPQSHPKDAFRRLQIKLTTEHGGWRIDDITDLTDSESPYALRKSLINDIELNHKAPQPKS